MSLQNLYPHRNSNCSVVLHTMVIRQAWYTHSVLLIIPHAPGVMPVEDRTAASGGGAGRVGGREPPSRRRAFPWRAAVGPRAPCARADRVRGTGAPGPGRGSPPDTARGPLPWPLPLSVCPA